MQQFDQIKAIINNLKSIIADLKISQISMEDIRNVQLAAEGINQIFYHSDKLKFQKTYDLENEEDWKSDIEEIEELIRLWEQTLQRRAGEKSVDSMFWDIYEYFKYVDVETIYQTVVRHFSELPENIRQEYLSLPKRYTFLHNKLDYTQEDFSLIAQYLKMMVDEIEKYKWLYEHLADYRSKWVLNGIIRYWFDFDLGKLSDICETTFLNYYDLDILECGDNEVVVDLGAFVGDSVVDYIHTYGTYKKIYAYEITKNTYETLIENTSMYQNVIAMNKGVGRKAGKMYIFEDNHMGAGNRLSESGDTEVEVVTLDEDVTGPITLIKMDIEGAEKDAIMGAVSHIKADRPKMLISSYHLPEDIFEIPYLVNGIRDDYKFYLRFNGRGCIWPCDYVLFAV